MLKTELRNIQVRRELQEYVRRLFDLRIGEGRWEFATATPSLVALMDSPLYSTLELAGILTVTIHHADLPGVSIEALVVVPANWRDELAGAALVLSPPPPLDLTQGDTSPRREVFAYGDPETGSHSVAP